MRIIPRRGKQLDPTQLEASSQKYHPKSSKDVIDIIKLALPDTLKHSFISHHKPYCAWSNLELHTTAYPPRSILTNEGLMCLREYSRQTWRYRLYRADTSAAALCTITDYMAKGCGALSLLLSLHIAESLLQSRYGSAFIGFNTLRRSIYLIFWADAYLCSEHTYNIFIKEHIMSPIKVLHYDGPKDHGEAVGVHR